MKRIPIPLMVVLVLLSVGIWFAHRPRTVRTQLTYSGVVEATTVECAFEMTGTVSEVLVQEGQTVASGQLLARLDNRALKASLAQAQAREGAAKARYDQLKRGFRPEEIAQAEARLSAAQADLEQMQNGPTAEEVESARAQMQAAEQRAQMMGEGYRQEEVAGARHQWEMASTNLQLTQKDYQRFLQLHKEGAISDQQLESRKNQLAQAQGNFRVATDTYQKLRSGPRKQEKQGAWDDFRAASARYRDLQDGYRPEQIAKAQANAVERARALDLMRQGARQEEIEAARRQWQEAQAAVQGVQVQLSKTELHSPCAGILSVRNLEPGEAVNPGLSVLTLADLHHPWVNLYLPEDELARVKLGQAGQITGDGIDQPVAGKIIRIYEKAEFTPKFIQTPKERTNLVYRAKMAVDNPELKLHPGQPVDVELKS